MSRPLHIRPLIYVVLLLAAGATFFVDAPAGTWREEHSPRSLAKFMGLVSHYGDWPWLMAAALVLLFLGWRFGLAWRQTLIAMMIASTLAGFAVNSLRLTTGRTRPINTAVEQGWYGPSKIGQYKFNSFPSGHTATAAGAAFILLFNRVWLALLGILFALLMAVARITTGAHHPSDTAFALVVALAVADYVRHGIMPYLAARVPFLRGT